MTRFPVSDHINVIEGKTFYKEDGWWKAIVLYTKGSSSKKKLALYWWVLNDSWQRIGKWQAESMSQWEKEKRKMDSMIGRADI